MVIDQGSGMVLDIVADRVADDYNKEQHEKGNTR